MMLKQIAVGVGVLALVCLPYTFFPDRPDWFKLDASWAAPGHSGDGGNNGGHTGMGGGGSNGQGGGDGGNGGHSGHGGEGGNGGNGGGNGGGNHGGGDGGHNGGGSTGGGGSHAGGSVSAGASGPDGATGTVVNDGRSGYGDREHLVAVLKMCTWDRLATYDTTYQGGWSVRTFDDVQWPQIYRCMKAHGYEPNGPDYTQQTNFGSR